MHAPELITEVGHTQPKSVDRLHDRSDVTFIHLGAVYELIGIQQDIMLQFCTEHGYDKSLCTDLELPKAVVSGLQAWGNLLQQIPNEWFETFNIWLLNQLFLRRYKDGRLHIWWRPRHQLVTIPDPTEPAISEKSVDIHYYLPFGNLGCSELEGGLFFPHLVFRDGQPPYPGTEPEPHVWQRQ